MFKKLGVSLVVLCCGAIAASAQTPNNPKYDLTRIGARGIGTGVNTYSAEREARLGQRMADVVASQARLVRDPLVNEYLTNLVNRLAEYSDMPMPYTVKIVDSDQTEAYAFPGGHMFVNSGLILATEDEAQLAGVLAHEIAHVAARHATRIKSKSFLMNLVSVPLSFAGPLAYSAGMATPIYAAKFARDAENEADLLGLQYMYSAGYDPAEFVKLFEKLTTHQRRLWNPRVLRAMVPEPAPQDRLANATEIVSRMLPPKSDYIVSTSEYDAARARLLELGNYQGKKGADGTRPRLRKPRVPRRDRGSEKPATVPGQLLAHR